MKPPGVELRIVRDTSDVNVDGYVLPGTENEGVAAVGGVDGTGELDAEAVDVALGGGTFDAVDVAVAVAVVEARQSQAWPASYAGLEW